MVTRAQFCKELIKKGFDAISAKAVDFMLTGIKLPASVQNGDQCHFCVCITSSFHCRTYHSLDV